ncbi:rRNA pseudouridine synthase [archaeon]|jgi:23S rRNA pseudouridine2605 synthase|nr:rRNA pseudouridine synthase [archaeon]MBT4647630.1 rRNA pseudouridine synthase [archaeon]MBT5491483.1 rRNA pseudouridine synthase [bacterium]MBT6822606.1 rRNA pseudouridine synthase [archaeon]MBT7392791.1 rRNA pseudouridine synthase [archaeon]
MLERVQKILSNLGYCSRRDAEKLISAGKVKVNGVVIRLGEKATKKDKILVYDKPIDKEQPVYLKFHKPAGCVTALKDEKYKTVMEYIHIKERVFPIGRLDSNSSGLLLLTNDGDFANFIMHPRNKIKKTYLVRVDRPLKKEDLAHLQEGVILRDGKTRPTRIKKIKADYFEITIQEGKYRIIKRMLKRLNYHVTSLKRIKIGSMKLAGLKVSEYVKFDPENYFMKKKS